ncbi:MAG TPA: WYL domain-containing protein [Spirochaetota bacterium]|mgnify:CR=1 FL=1|nr:WYL domain-containing protein [Spirochaetota bacterium]
MIEHDQKPFPNPEGKINVLKRYLHILALLQYSSQGEETWNANKLADLLSEDEMEKPLDDSQVRKYIENNIEKDLGIDIDKAQGKTSMSVAANIDIETQLKIARVYADFVVKDTGRDMVLKKFIEAMPDRALWTLARIYFAVVEKRMIQFNYVTNKGYRINRWKLCPYYFLFRNNNLYLAAWDPTQKKHLSLLADRIRDLTVLEKSYAREWHIPPVEELFKDALSAFISDSGPVTIRIRYRKEAASVIESIISPLDPETILVEEGKWFEAEFSIADYLFLCKQFVIYGSNVEILSPPDVRNAMINMLKESLGVYEK